MMPSGAMHGGLPMAHIILLDLDTFVREVLQNSRDQRVGDQPVKVWFRFDHLSGELKDTFLTGLGWKELRPHIENAASLGGITIAPQLERALEVIRDEPLLVLRIDDSGTVGLTGDEDEHGENFNALCQDFVGSKTPSASHPKDLSARHRPALGLDFPLVMLHTHSQSTP
jgi:hypothetical protein